MKSPKIFIPLGIIAFLITMYFAMQLSVPEIEKTIIAVYSSDGKFTRSINNIIDSTIFYRMNWKSKYIQCQTGPCATEVAIRHSIAVHLFFIGRMYYEYDLLVTDEEGKGVYGCRTVPARVNVVRCKGAWRIVGHYEKP